MPAKSWRNSLSSVSSGAQSLDTPSSRESVDQVRDQSRIRDQAPFRDHRPPSDNDPSADDPRRFRLRAYIGGHQRSPGPQPRPAMPSPQSRPTNMPFPITPEGQSNKEGFYEDIKDIIPQTLTPEKSSVDNNSSILDKRRMSVYSNVDDTNPPALNSTLNSNTGSDVKLRISRNSHVEDNRKSIYANIGEKRESAYSNLDSESGHYSVLDQSQWSDNSLYYEPSIGSSFSSVTLPVSLQDETADSLLPHSPDHLRVRVPQRSASAQRYHSPASEKASSYCSLQPPKHRYSSHSNEEPVRTQPGEYRYHTPRYLQKNGHSPTDTFYYKRNLSCPSLDTRNFVFIMQYKFNYKGK